MSHVTFGGRVALTSDEVLKVSSAGVAPTERRTAKQLQGLGLRLGDVWENPKKIVIRTNVGEFRFKKFLYAASVRLSDGSVDRCSVAVHANAADDGDTLVLKVTDAESGPAERAILAALNANGADIVAAVDVTPGEVGSGRAYIVMQQATGSLGDLRGACSDEQAYRIGREIVAMCRAAASKGYLFTDCKPENLLYFFANDGALDLAFCDFQSFFPRFSRTAAVRTYKVAHPERLDEERAVVSAIAFTVAALCTGARVPVAREDDTHADFEAAASAVVGSLGDSARVVRFLLETVSLDEAHALFSAPTLGLANKRLADAAVEKGRQDLARDAEDATRRLSKRLAAKRR